MKRFINVMSCRSCMLLERRSSVQTRVSSTRSSVRAVVNISRPSSLSTAKSQNVRWNKPSTARCRAICETAWRLSVSVAALTYYNTTWHCFLIVSHLSREMISTRSPASAGIANRPFVFLGFFFNFSADCLSISKGAELSQPLPCNGRGDTAL